MMAAGVAAKGGKRVLLLEGNKRLGEKLRISGGGRCNITNAQHDVHKLLENYGEADKFLHSAFSQFGVQDTFSFFEGRNLPLKVEANNRAFPQSEDAGEVVRTLEAFLAEGAVAVRKGARVVEIVHKGGTIEGVKTKTDTYVADSYVLATGGVSHPETGSTGDGFTWLRALGHQVKDPTPTIVPLKIREAWAKKLSGIAVKGVKLTIFAQGVKKFTVEGGVLFTHFGISGPTVLNMAGKVADLLYDGDVSMRIDLFPKEDLGILDKRIAAAFDLHKNKTLRNALKELLPAGTVDVLLSQLETLDPETKVHSVRKEERRAIAQLVKGLSITITGLMGFERAVVADGGVVLTEVDTRTMRSLLYKNLYITGDLLNITRPSGGYSLQLCWTTGYVAGKNA